MRIRFNPLYIFLIGAAAVLADAVTTWIALHQPGLGEQNPLAIWMIDAMGLGLALVLRVIFGIAVFYIMVRVSMIRPSYEQIGLTVTAMAVVWTIYVVANNVHWIGKVV